MNFIISKEQGDKLFNYLIKQPYGEVAELITILGSLQPIQVPPVQPNTVEETTPVVETKEKVNENQ